MPNNKPAIPTTPKNSQISISKLPKNLMSLITFFIMMPLSLKIVPEYKEQVCLFPE